MTSLSVVGLPLLLCLVTLVVVVVSWLLQIRIEPSLFGRRLVLFRSGVVLGALGLIVTASCFVDPFPLVQHSDGSLSNTWLEWAWMAAFLLAVISAGLALFGKGKARLLLITAEVFSVLLTFASFLQNGV